MVVRRVVLAAIAHRKSTTSAALVAAAAALAGGGCSPAPPTGLISVTGRVLLDGEPLERGAVSLRPESRETWHQPTGTIAGPEGRYSVFTNGRPGAPPGTYRVVVFANGPVKTPSGAAHPGLPASLVPKRYNDPQTTPLRIVVPPAGPPSSSPPSFDLEIVSDVR